MRWRRQPDGWKAIRLFLFLLLLQAAVACRTAAQATESVAVQIPLDGRQIVALEIVAGEVSLIGGGPADEVRIEGWLQPRPGLQFTYEQLPDRLLVRLKDERRPWGGYRTAPAKLTIHLPDGLAVMMDSFEADAVVEDLRGELQLNTTAGDIHARRLQGEIALISARGNVTLQDAQGQIRLLGEHGVLTLQGVSGRLGVSTIMGTIRYLGAPAPGDEIRIEVDHGPVEILLAPEANLEVLIRSTSGEVVCLAPALQSSARECRGRLGTGGASLAVRTVSGNVTLRLGEVFP